MTGISNRRRWALFALVLTATILNLVDRQIIAVLKPTIAGDLGWTDNDYGTLAAWFQGAAAVAFLFTGWIVDRLGIKWANPLGVVAWSLAAIAHGWARTMTQFILCRVALGATEAMGTPATIKSIATIFEPERRSLGFGASNAIGSLGLIFGPVAILGIAGLWGWRAAFVGGGVLGLIWSIAWLLTTRGVDFGDRSAPPAKTEDTSQPTESIFAHRRTWAIAIAKFLSDATWWLFLYWLPDFLNRTFGHSGFDLGLRLGVAYGCGALGALLAGVIATRLIGAGMPVNRVRKGSLLIAALLVLPVPFAVTITDDWTAVALIGLAIAAHQAFSTNLFALIADVTPVAQVGRVTSFGAFSGNLGGLAIAKITGLLLSAGFGYMPLFLFAASSYLLAIGVIQLLIPRIVRPEGGVVEVVRGH